MKTSIIFCLLSIPMLTIGQHTYKHNLEYEYSYRTIKWSYYYIEYSDTSSCTRVGTITDSLISDSKKYLSKSLLYTYHVHDFLHLGLYIENSKFNKNIGFHEKFNCSELLFKNPNSRLQLYANAGFGFIVYSKKHYTSNNRHTAIIDNYYLGIETTFNIIKHINMHAEVSYFSDNSVISSHPLFCRFGISYNWGKKN